MKTYNGNTKAIRGPIIGFTVISALIILLLFFAEKNFWIYFLLVILFLMAPMFYAGIIFKVTLDDEKIKIYRLGYVDKIKFSNIAICADNKIDEERSLLYCFVRRGKYVKAMKQKIEFKEVVRKVLAEENMMDFDLNFNRAKKIQLAFVQDGNTLKNEIIYRLGEVQIELLNS